MKIFISYRRKDSKYVVDRIRDRLIAVYSEDAVFRDIESIPLGQNFSDVLNEATSTCNVMLVVIGPEWAGITDAQGNKRLFDPGDYTRIEIETGLAHKEILVIPVLVMNATMPATTDIPESLADLRFRNAISVRNDPDFNPDMLRLIQGINSFLGSAPISVQSFEPDTFHIPAGSFWMGSDPGEGIPAYETPQHEISLPAYRIGKFPVTNKQYAVFMRKTGRSALEIRWKSQKIPEGMENHPVTGVNWYDALAYCRWLSEETQRHYSLPSEAQWEKACRGGKKTLYPWGDEFNPALCNHGQSELSAVNKYLAQNDYGCFDFVGNVRQWTCSLWGTDYEAPDQEYVYPWLDDDGRNDLDASRLTWRVLRGSSFRDEQNLLRCSYKCGDSPESRGVPESPYGFRVMMTDK